MGYDYDVIVIGAGLGGLSAAYECLKSGFKTLIVEQHNLPGGFATSFIRGRFEFEPSLHELPYLDPEIDDNGVVSYLKNDVQIPVEFLELPEAYRLVLTENSIDFRMPFRFPNIIAEIEKLYPGSAGSISAYLSLCHQTQQSFRDLVTAKNKNRLLGFFQHNGGFIRNNALTVDQVAESMNLSKDLQALLYPYWCYLGVPMDRLSFTLWAAMLNSYLSHKAVIPKNRSHEIAAGFMEKIYAMNGKALFNTKVIRIATVKNRVTGIHLADNSVITSGAVVCNTSPTNAFSFLLDHESKVLNNALKNIRARKSGLSFFVVYLGLNKSATELGFTDYSYFIAPHMDTARLYNATNSINSDEYQIAAVCLNNGNKDCSPPGTTILSLTIGQKPEAWKNVKPESYHQEKIKLAKKIIRYFEESLNLEITPYIEEMEIAAPPTFARYTGAYDGAVYGYEAEPWDSILPRSVFLHKENYLDGLSFCGGHSSRAHGFGSAILSGKVAAENLSKRRKNG